MGYPRVDLDEYTDAELIEEICRRIVLQEQELCTYCGRERTAPPCKLPDTHRATSHIFAQLIDTARSKFSKAQWPLSRGTCNCKPGYPHDPDCDWWDLPKDKR
jgi:hypothetical protein